MTTPELLKLIDNTVSDHEIKHPRTLLAIALERNPALKNQETISGEDFAKVGIPILSSCWRCGATLGTYNAFVNDPDTDRPSCEECL